MADFNSIIKDIQNKIFAPVYFFYWEEPFFIDQLTSYIEQNALDESVRDLNQTILYGRDVLARDIIDLARRFPMFGNYQLVIVKEAQDLKDIEGLESYLNAPLKSTILVISFKHKKPDGRKSVFKKLKDGQGFVSFESKKIYENQLPAWIEKAVSKMGCTIQPLATQLIADYIGNDLARISNELEKLFINLQRGGAINVEKIEEYIGISKDYNVFELQNALASQNAFKAQRIVQHFELNPKENPLQMLTVILHNYFIKVLICQQLKNKDDNAIAAEIGIRPLFVKDYRLAARAFSGNKIKNIISDIRTIDLKSRGVGATDSNDYGDLKELVFKILHN